MRRREWVAGLLALGTFLAFMLLTACTTPSAATCTADSVAAGLQTRLDSANARLGRAGTLYLQQLQVTAYAEQRALYYARIVVKRPASAIYLVGWLTRAFTEALPDTTRTP